MSISQELQELSEVPFSHGVLMARLTAYRRPNDKISHWLADQSLIAIKRGFYVCNPSLTGQPLSLPLIANQLYGPSYVSLDYALSHYGLIPETVHQITSVTTRRGKTYDTLLGRFSYERLGLRVYPLGIVSTRNEAGHYYLMASKDKSLCDKLIQTPNLTIASPASLLSYLIEDLRLDMNQLADFDLALVGRIAAAGFKRRLLESLSFLLEKRLWTS
jgi:hypothetical protein